MKPSFEKEQFIIKEFKMNFVNEIVRFVQGNRICLTDAAYLLAKWSVLFWKFLTCFSSDGQVCTLSRFFGRRTSPLIEHRTNASLVDGYFWTKNSHCAMRQLGGRVHMKGLGPLWFLRKNDGQRVMFLRSYSLPRSSQFFNQRAGIVICSSFGLNSKF